MNDWRSFAVRLDLPCMAVGEDDVARPLRVPGFGIPHQVGRVIAWPRILPVQPVQQASVQSLIPLVTGASLSEDALAVLGTAEELWAGGRSKQPGQHDAGRIRQAGWSAVRGQPGQASLVLVGVESQSDTDLPEVAQTACGTGFGLRRAECRQEQAAQNSNNCDDNQQFDEGEAGLASEVHFGPSPPPRQPKAR